MNTYDHCNYSTTDFDKMNAHEAAHKDAEVLANRINGLIAEYNSKHDDMFCIAKYTPNLAKKSVNAKTDVKKPCAENKKPAVKPSADKDSAPTNVHPVSKDTLDDLFKKAFGEAIRFAVRRMNN